MIRLHSWKPCKVRSRAMRRAAILAAFGVRPIIGPASGKESDPRRK
ncbi:hypothetical protein [Aurantiacibacter gilvus]|uniref:Uncharacterized protein n=1 Tax=Aurantiacibacter gilvus TaxID=3139141 RepID=A0ABU9IG64_9SPHN